MHDAVVRVPTPHNEPVLPYGPGSPEKRALKAELARMAGEVVEIPCIIGGKRVTTGRVDNVVMPHRHGHVLARYHKAGAGEMEKAVAAARAARAEWSAMRWEARAAIFLRAAELLATKWRAIINASTMLGQSKTAHQAEIDAACESIDFWRFNCAYAEQLYAQQPAASVGVWNALELRPLEGFVFAVTPFNFTSIGANLPTAPALMGNTVLWKPSSTALLSNYYLMLLLEEAGLPPGVINFLPGGGAELGNLAIDSPELAGVHFTGSTPVFQGMWQRAAANLGRYKSYPRLVGETGGKDFILAHPSADPDVLVTAIVRGGYEYQGQKCSAASRIYVPDGLWQRIRDTLVSTIDGLPAGDPTDFRNFMGAVIDRRAFDKHSAAIAEARGATGVTIAAGGQTDGSEGYFVRPTLIVVDDPNYRTMHEELFGPVVTLHPYPEARWEETLRLVDQTSPYALTGAVIANDRRAIVQAMTALRQSAGNFYVNDKPTGAVVGQQPFGGARASGTNDKAGSALNLLRWASARTIKENFAPPTDHRYPYMKEA